MQREPCGVAGRGHVQHGARSPHSPQDRVGARTCPLPAAVRPAQCTRRHLGRGQDTTDRLCLMEHCPSPQRQRSSSLERPMRSAPGRRVHAGSTPGRRSGRGLSLPPCSADTHRHCSRADRGRVRGSVCPPQRLTGGDGSLEGLPCFMGPSACTGHRSRQASPGRRTVPRLCADRQCAIGGIGCAVPAAVGVHRRPRCLSIEGTETRDTAGRLAPH